jgi:glycosyltransferase involved in cell wall biosynthesis
VSFRATVVLVARDTAFATLRCLMTVARLPEDAGFETVVVDNGSSDATPDILAGIEGDFTVLRNATDTGYGPACDQAAAVARGRHLVFLREDAVPVDGWFDALLGALDARPEAGAALPLAARIDGAVLAHEWPALAIRAEAYAAVGGFAGTDRPACAEKATLLEALERAGRPVVAAPGAVVLAGPEALA